MNDIAPDPSPRYLTMALGTDRLERIDHPDGHGKRTGRCGDTIEMFVNLDGDRIRRVAYGTDGCLNTNACANAVAHLAEGKTLAEAWAITPEEVAASLESLPEDHYHCAELAAGAFYLALADIRETRNTPWKKLYR